MVHINDDGYYLIVDLDLGGVVAAARLLMWGRASDLARMSMSVTIWWPCVVSLHSFVLVLLANTSSKGDRCSPNLRKLQSFVGGEESLLAKSAQVAELFWRGAIAACQFHPCCKVVMVKSCHWLPNPHKLQSCFGAE